MTPRAKRVLAALIKFGDDAEIVCEGLECWIGFKRTGWHTVNYLLGLMALKDVSDTKWLQRYVITDTGRSLIARPELESELRVAILKGTSFTVTPEHKIKDLKP